MLDVGNVPTTSKGKLSKGGSLEPLLEQRKKALTKVKAPP
jgi:hypothetical protein